MSFIWFHYGILSFTCCSWLICHKQEQLISPSSISASSCSIVMFAYLCMASLPWYIVLTPYLKRYGPVVFGPAQLLVFYHVPSWICCWWFDHWGAPSRAESILLNKNVWQFVAVNGPMLWHKRVRLNWGDALLQLRGPVGSFRAIRLLHSELFNGYRVMPWSQCNHVPPRGWWVLRTI